MTKENLLEWGLTEEQANKVMEGLNGSFVTKSRFNEVNTELTNAKNTIKERDTQLETLKKSTGDTKALQDQITLEMSRNVQSGNTQNLKSTVIQRSFPKWSVAERRKTAAASDQAAVCACAHSRYFAGGSPSGLRV